MAEWMAGNTVANGINLHYYRTGGAKPPLVLSHGITDNGLCWTRATHALAQVYDVIMVDARGHGHSDAPDSGYSSSTHAADLAGVIQALELSQPRLMGHSMGAATTATLAATYPDLVGRIVLEDPPWRLTTGEEDDTVREQRRQGIQQWRDRIIAQQTKRAEEIARLGREMNPGWDEVEFGPWAAAKKQVKPQVFDYGAGPQVPWQELVPQIACPALLVMADAAAGGIVDEETAAEVRRLNSGIQIAHIGGAGHNIRREQFDRFMQAVTEFLAEA